MVGKKFRTKFGTDAPVDPMLVFCIKRKNSSRRYAGLKKCAATALENKTNGVPSGSRDIFLVQNWRTFSILVIQI